MEEGEASDDELFDKAVEAIAAVAEGTGELADARAAFLEVSDFRPRGMLEEIPEPGPERSYGEAANSLKMALDALEGDQRHLARSYIKVAKIKLEKAREA